MKQSFRKLFAGLALAGLAAATMAQQTPPTAAPTQRHEMRDAHETHGHMDREQMRQRMGERSGERMQKRLGKLKEKLAIAPAQEGAWNAWTASMKPPATRPEHMSREDFARLTTPERLDRMRAMSSERQARMEARANATKQFYAALSPEQQKLFDRAALGTRAHRGPHVGHGGEHHSG